MTAFLHNVSHCALTFNYQSTDLLFQPLTEPCRVLILHLLLDRIQIPSMLIQFPWILYIQGVLKRVNKKTINRKKLFSENYLVLTLFLESAEGARAPRDLCPHGSR